MGRNPTVKVQVDLQQIRANAQSIRRQTGVALYAVLKADAYGLGAAPVAYAIDDLVDAWCVFSLEEACALRRAHSSSKPVIILGPPLCDDAEQYRRARARPSIWTVQQAAALRPADPLLAVDTGMERFACPPEEVEQVLKAGCCREAFTHATRSEQALQLRALLDGRHLLLHAAASDLLHDPQARLDAVRPGMALYRGALTVTTWLAEVHESRGPAGYSGFQVPRHGVLLCGYSRGLRPGCCLVNGQIRRILEVGMQSAYVELGPKDRIGDTVTLLGGTLDVRQLADLWGCPAQEVLLSLARAGQREYIFPR